MHLSAFLKELYFLWPRVAHTNLQGRVDLWDLWQKLFHKNFFSVFVTNFRAYCVVVPNP